MKVQKIFVVLIALSGLFSLFLGISGETESQGIGFNFAGTKNSVDDRASELGQQHLTMVGQELAYFDLTYPGPLTWGGIIGASRYDAVDQRNADAEFVRSQAETGQFDESLQQALIQELPGTYAIALPTLDGVDPRINQCGYDPNETFRSIIKYGQGDRGALDPGFINNYGEMVAKFKGTDLIDQPEELFYLTTLRHCPEKYVNYMIARNH